MKADHRMLVQVIETVPKQWAHKQKTPMSYYMLTIGHTDRTSWGKLASDGVSGVSSWCGSFGAYYCSISLSYRRTRNGATKQENVFRLDVSMLKAAFGILAHIIRHRIGWPFGKCATPVHASLVGH